MNGALHGKGGWTLSRKHVSQFVPSRYPIEIKWKNTRKEKEMLAKMVLYHYLIVADQFFFDDFHGVEALSFLELYH